MRPLAAAALTLLGCTTGGPYQAGRPIDTYPRFTAEQSSWFDDAIAIDIFGMQTRGPLPGSDPALVERVANADTVIPVLVTTVTSDTVGSTPAYQLVLAPVGPPMAGASESQPITVTVPTTSTSYPYVKVADETLVGRRLILFARRFSGAGQAVIHWHAEVDTPEMRLAVRQAAVALASRK